MEIFDFGLRLRELREKKNLSQADIAAKLGLTRGQISAYECNTSYPSVEKLIDLAILFNTSVDYMLGINNRPCVYLDDFKPEQQESIRKIIEMLRENF